MSKHQYFLWLLKHNAIYCGKDLERWTGRTVPCPRCNSSSETLEHAFFSCSYINQFWNRVCSRLSTDNNQTTNFKNLTTLSFRPNPSKSNITNMLPITCALWTIHRARIDTIYKQTQYTVQALYSLWINSIHNILKAKYHTALARATKEPFLRKWQWLITILNCSL